MSEHVNPGESLPAAPAARVNPIVRLAVEKRVTMTMIVFGILVLGVLSLLRLPLEFMPSFQNSNVSVFAPYNSSSPEEVARLIVRPLEDALSTINGVKRLSARASAATRRVPRTGAGQGQRTNAVLGGFFWSIPRHSDATLGFTSWPGGLQM